MVKYYMRSSVDSAADGAEAGYKCAPCFIDWQKLYPVPVASSGRDGVACRLQEKREACVSWGKRLRARLSLVLAHIVTRPGDAPAPVVIRPRQVFLPQLKAMGAKPSPGAERGEVVEFSAASRARMLRAMAGLDLAGRSVRFVTLTYDGRRDAVDCQEVRKHFRAFAARLERRAGYGGFLWRWEYQERGAAHFHLIVWGASGVGAFDCGWMVEAWHEITGSEQAAHLLYGVRVDEVAQDDCSQLVGYLAKYAAKDGKYPDWHRGRVWGIRGEKPRGGVVVAWIPSRVVAAARDCVARELAEMASYRHLEKVAGAVPRDRVDAVVASRVVAPMANGCAQVANGIAVPVCGGVWCNFFTGEIVRAVLLSFCRENGLEVARPGEHVRDCFDRAMSRAGASDLFECVE